jgi:phosphomannomutase
LCAAAVRAALEAGCDVDEIGLVGTEMLYYAVCEHGYDGGLIVTASHNPKQYNGMKIVRRGALPLGGDGGIEKVRDRALAGEFRTPKAPGKHGQRDVLQGFAERCLSIVDVDDIAPLEVVLDGANGMAGTMMTPILERLPLRAERAHFDPDGTFPHYQPNPLLEENRQFIISEVTKRGADLGIAWDGDADRCFFIDDNGQFVPGDFITALIAESLLAKRPGETILYDLRASRAVPDTVERMGGKAIASRVGHAFIKHRMRKENALFAGEVSGHYYFRDFYSVDTGIVPALVVLELVSRSGKRISELLAPLHERYHLSGEINTTVSDVPLKLQELKERYGPGGEGGRVTHLDGVSVDFDDWHFNVRPSNTEPLLRLNLEAYSEAEMVRRRDEVLGLIRS